MITKSLRLSDSLVSAVREIGRAEQIEESAAMRKLLRMGYGLYLAEQYRAGRRTLRDVADRQRDSTSAWTITSPGMNRTRRKTMTLSMRSVGMISSSRLMTYALMADAWL